MEDHHVNRCTRCEMRAPAGKKLCRACARADDPRAVLEQIAASDSRPATTPHNPGALTPKQIAVWSVILGSVAAIFVLRAGTGDTRTRNAAEARHPMSDADLALVEATDAVAAIRAYYNIGQAVGTSDWKWAECHDQAKTFAAVLKCAKDVAAEVRRHQQTLPRGSVAATACGRAIAEAHILYVDGQDRYHADVVAWLETNRAALTKALARKALPDACDVIESICASKPDASDTKYGQDHGASYARVNGIECTKQLFQCGPPDNVCWINKVAARLGLGSDSRPSDGLYVRATGARLQ